MNQLIGRRAIWPLVLTSIIWSLAAVYFGLPLTGGGHGPLQGIGIVALAPMIIPIGLMFLSENIVQEARGCLFAGLVGFTGIVDVGILLMLGMNMKDILELGDHLLWYLGLWLLLWFGGQIVIGFFVLKLWRTTQKAGSA